VTATATSRRRSGHAHRDLKNEKGETRPVVASEEVKNFDQIKKGDKVSLKYMEALTLELKKDGKAVVGARTRSR
jgi:hypothetical protein